MENNLNERLEEILQLAAQDIMYKTNMFGEIHDDDDDMQNIFDLHGQPSLQVQFRSIIARYFS